VRGSPRFAWHYPMAYKPLANRIVLSEQYSQGFQFTTYPSFNTLGKYNEFMRFAEFDADDYSLKAVSPDRSIFNATARVGGIACQVFMNFPFRANCDFTVEFLGANNTTLAGPFRWTGTWSSNYNSVNMIFAILPWDHFLSSDFSVPDYWISTKPNASLTRTPDSGVNLRVNDFASTFSNWADGWSIKFTDHTNAHTLFGYSATVSVNGLNPTPGLYYNVTTSGGTKTWTVKSDQRDVVGGAIVPALYRTGFCFDPRDDSMYHATTQFITSTDFFSGLPGATGRQTPAWMLTKFDQSYSVLSRSKILYNGGPVLVGAQRHNGSSGINDAEPRSMACIPPYLYFGICNAFTNDGLWYIMRGKIPGDNEDCNCTEAWPTRSTPSIQLMSRDFGEPVFLPVGS
jgi:hypothetical protein